ncbi:MAG: phosphoribosylamine--glycine ligase [Oscillospiraceae bacterium]
MKVLVVGSGGREHAIIKKLKSNPTITEVFAAPGNGGISFDATCIDIKPNELDKIVDFCKLQSMDYVVVAPDEPLVLGLVDKLSDANIPSFGPTAAAAAIEGSKVFSKNLMKKYKIPTAAYEVFDSAHAACEYIKANTKYPLVIKADGLALGKGVLICQNEEEALAAVQSIMQDKKFGASGNSIVIEEFLVGVEVSVLCFTDGKTMVPMVSSMDHKRALDGDKGLNTGGMGAIAPNPFYTEDLAKSCMQRIFIPTMNAMNEENRRFRGCLYFGLILTTTGPKVIEYNCRFGDPETQVVLPLLESDLFTVMQAVSSGKLANVEVKFSDKKSACVILASKGYPEKYEVDKRITGLVSGEVRGVAGTCAYHAGTRLLGRELLTSGGRVLGITAIASTLPQAIENAYAAANTVSFDGMHMRTDIGKLALKARV